MPESTSAATLATSRAFAFYLVGIGLAAGVALAFPIVVLFGLVLGILPGIILYLAPTLFLYSLLWWGTRALLLHAAAYRGVATGTRPFRLIASAVSVVIVAVPMTLVPNVINTSIKDKAAMLRAEDRALAAPISFPPVVAVVMPNRENLACEEICQRLLYNRAATRVIMAEPTRPGRQASTVPTAYWIEKRDTCPAPALTRRHIVWPVDLPKRGAYPRGTDFRGNDPRSRVLARIAAGDCLMHDKARLEDAGLTISYSELGKGGSPYASPWSLTLDTVEAKRLEVVEAGGGLLYRQTEVMVQPLSAPLSIETRSGLMTTVTYAGWSRWKETHAPIGPNGRDVLPALLGDVARPIDRPPG